MTEGTDKIVDPEVLETLRQLDKPGQPSFLGEMIGIFFEDMPPRLSELRQALDTGNVEDVTQLAHTIKGSCGNFGAEVLQGLCRSLEVLGRAGELTGAPELVRAIEVEYDRVQQALTSYL